MWTQIRLLPRGSSLIRVHIVGLHENILSEVYLNICSSHKSRHYFQDKNRGRIRVKSHYNDLKQWFLSQVLLAGCDIGNSNFHLSVCSSLHPSVCQRFVCLQLWVSNLVQLVMSLTADPGVASLILARSQTFMEIGHEIISVVSLLPLIQEGLLSVTSESMCTKYWLTA